MSELPAGWEQTTIGSLFTVVGGGTPATAIEPYWSGSIPWITSADISDRGAIEVRRRVSDEAVASSATNVVPADSVIVVTRVGLGKVARAPHSMAFSQDCQALLAIDGIDPEFLRLQLSKTALSLRAMGRGTTISGVTKKQLRDLPLSIPPTAEQHRIVAAIEEQFSRLDAGTASIERVRQRLRWMRAAVLQTAMTGHLVPQDRADVDASTALDEAWAADQSRSGERPVLETQGETLLPASWEWVRWVDILATGADSFKRGPFGSSLTKASFVSSGYKVYEQYCPINDDCSFVRYYIAPEKFKELEGFAVRAGDFLISCSGSLGRITQVPEEHEAGVINQALLRVRINNQLIDDSFFRMLVRSPYFQREILNNSTGTAMANVKGVKDLKAIPLPLPPLAEQRRIVAEVDRFETFAASLSKSLDTLATRAGRLRAAILSAAFSGNLVPQDSNEEPASVLLKRIASVRGSEPKVSRKQEKVPA